MKQKDIVLIIVVVFVAAVLSFLTSKYLFSGDNAEQSVEKIDAISTTFEAPNDKYFNKNSLNPAQSIEVNNNANTSPFGNGN